MEGEQMVQGLAPRTASTSHKPVPQSSVSKPRARPKMLRRESSVFGLTGWANLLDEVRQETKDICDKITKEARVLQGCDKLLGACTDEKNRRQVEIMKSFAESQLSTMRTQLKVLNGQLHRSVREGIRLARLGETQTLKEMLASPCQATTQNDVPFIVIPCSLSAQTFDWQQSVGQRLETHFLESSARFYKEFDQLNAFRSECEGYANSPNSLQASINYFHCIDQLKQVFFPSSKLENGDAFHWYDPFSGAEAVSNDIMLEQATCLFNAAATATQMAARPGRTKEKYILRTKACYEMATGVLDKMVANGFCLQQYGEHLSPSLIKLFKKITEAQTQECTWRLHVLKGKDHFGRLWLPDWNVVAGVSVLYQSLARSMKNFQQRRLPEEWFIMVTAKMQYYRGLTCIYYALHVLQDDGTYIDMEGDEDGCSSAATTLPRDCRLDSINDVRSLARKISERGTKKVGYDYADETLEPEPVEDCYDNVEDNDNDTAGNGHDDSMDSLDEGDMNTFEKIKKASLFAKRAQLLLKQAHTLCRQETRGYLLALEDAISAQRITTDKHIADFALDTAVDDHSAIIAGDPRSLHSIYIDPFRFPRAVNTPHLFARLGPIEKFNHWHSFSNRRIITICDKQDQLGLTLGGGRPCRIANFRVKELEDGTQDHGPIGSAILMINSTDVRSFDCGQVLQVLKAAVAPLNLTVVDIEQTAPAPETKKYRRSKIVKGFHSKRGQCA
eukprot:m.31214 g.31214  ORF g.31214 m.31214 type:complete len:730 (+) comp9390_c0_seq1:100-2289(+)